MIKRQAIMKKAVFTVLALFMLTSSAFAECRYLRLGFVTIVSGTEMVDNYVWIDNGENFVRVNQPIERPCSEGNRWQWFWE